MTEDEMDVDPQQSLIKNAHSQPPAPDLEPLEENVQTEAAAAANDNDSFVSANEDVENAAENARDDDQATVPDEDTASSRPVTQDSNASSAFEHGNTLHSENWQVEEEHKDREEAVDDDLDEDDAVKSPSDLSTPDKPLVRKSSLTFAALPARESRRRGRPWSNPAARRSSDACRCHGRAIRHSA